MASYILFLFLLVILLSSADTVSAAPVLTLTSPMTIQATLHPPLSSNTMYELCGICRDVLQFCQCWSVSLVQVSRITLLNSLGQPLRFSSAGS